MNRASVELLAVIVAFVIGAWYGARNTAAEVDGAVITALRAESKRNEEVVNGWNLAVLALRARIRNGDAPKIPVPAAPGTPAPPGGTPGTTPSGIPLAGELATCRAERKQLIEDGANTMITCHALQQWAR